MKIPLLSSRFLKRGFACLTLCLWLLWGDGNALGQGQQTPTPWRPQLYFGTVNFNEQLTQLETWKQTANRVDGMLLHIHYFVRHMNTPQNQKLANAEATIRKIAPALHDKSNIFELTYHIRDANSSPEDIAKEHAKNIETIEEAGIPVAVVNVDWILSGLQVQIKQTPRLTGESNDVYFTRILDGVLAKSARYVTAFRAAGRDEKLIAVFPPIYLDEGPWTNVRQEKRPGVTASRVLNGLFDIGFDGFVADSPFSVLSNSAYRAAGYYDALRSIEWTCHQRGKSFGFIINGNNSLKGAAYDAQFAKSSLASLDLVREAGLRPDQIVLESWYKGPFVLVPDNEPGTLTNTLLQVANKLDAVAKEKPD